MRTSIFNKRPFPRVLFQLAMGCGTIFFLLALAGVLKAEDTEAKQIAPGVWKLHFGVSDAYTPCHVRVAEMKGADSFAKLPSANEPPFELKSIRCKITPVRTVLRIPCGNRLVPFHNRPALPGRTDHQSRRSP